MCKLVYKNFQGSFSDTDEPFELDVYYKPIYTRGGIEIKTNMPTLPLYTFSTKSWRREKKLIQMWMR